MSDSIDTSSSRLNSDYWKYWTGQTISNLGSSVTTFALPLLVYKLTGSALNLGITSATTFLPYLLFGLLLGAWMDRVDRKRMMILTDIARALIIATIPFLAMLGMLAVWWIYVVSFIHSTLRICFDTGEFAAIPGLIKQDDLVTANGRIQASYSGAQIVGPLLAGLLLTTFPVVLLLLIDAGSFLVSSLSLALIKKSFNVGSEEAKEAQHIGHDIVEGLRYVLSHPVLRNISAMMALVNIVYTTVDTQLVLFTKQHLHANDPQVSLFYSVGSLGIVIFSLMAGILRKRWSFSRVALSALMLMGLLTVVIAFLPWYWAVLVLWAPIDGLGILFDINTGSLRQAIVPNHMLARVISIASVLAWSAIPIGSMLGGLAIEWTKNVVLVYAVCGTLTFLIPFAFSFTPLGHAERYLPQQEVGAGR